MGEGETNLETIERNIKEFTKIQGYMLIAKEENATRTYADLKKEYITLKAILNIAGVNLTELDIIKEQPVNKRVKPLSCFQMLRNSPASRHLLHCFHSTMLRHCLIRPPCS